MTELREARDRAVAEAAAAQAELKEFKAGTLFQSAGLGSKQAALFLKTNPDADITEAAVASFIEEYGFSVASTEEKPPAAPSGPPPNAALSAFEQAAKPTSGGMPAAQPKMTQEDFQKLLASNPEEAAKAYIEGRAPRNEANVQARELVNKGIINH